MSAFGYLLSPENTIFLNIPHINNLSKKCALIGLENHNIAVKTLCLPKFRDENNRIYLYCPVVTEKSTDPSVKVT